MAQAGAVARGKWTMHHLSIPARLTFLSTALFAMLVGSNLFLGNSLSAGVAAMERDIQLVRDLRNAIDTSKAFGDLKYWLLELAVSPRAHSQRNAELAWRQTRGRLDALERFDKEAVAVMRLEAGALMDTTSFAAEAYGEGRPELGDGFLAKALGHVQVVDQRLAGLVRELEIGVRRHRDAALDGASHAVVVTSIVTVLGAVLAFGLTVAVGRSIRVPLTRLMRATSAITAGDLDAPLPEPRSDEIGAMTRALAMLRDTIRERAWLVAEHERAEATVRRAQTNLSDAIESISEAFCLYDAEDRLVLSNERYRTQMFPGRERLLVPGTKFEEIIREAARHDLVREAAGDPERWVAERIARHRNPQGPHVYQRNDGRWFQVNERHTDDGGRVAVYMDITELKQREQELRVASRTADAALAEMRGVLEAIEFGVVIVDPVLRVRMSNRAFREMWGYPDGFFDDQPTLLEAMEWSQSQERYGLADDVFPDYEADRVAEIRAGDAGPRELRLADGRIIRYRCRTLPGDGRLLTYYDITDLQPAR